MHTLPKSYDNLLKIGSAYEKATDALNRPPNNLDELMPFLAEHGDPASLLRSPDDNEEYVILWGVDIRRIQPFPVTAYEKHGASGVRHVLRVRGVIPMSDEEFKKSPFPPPYKCPL